MYAWFRESVRGLWPAAYGVWLGLGIVLLFLVAVGTHPLDAQAQAPAPQTVYFPQTGHHVSEPFLGYWRAHGGIPIFGYPVTEELEVDGRTVQYFERARFEHHPELADVGYEVQIEHLGRTLLQERDLPEHVVASDTEASDNPEFRYFKQTGFHISYGFRDYWETYGGLDVFGYPLSREFEEDGRIVQYFERVRFEWWPEHQGTRHEVLLERLGAEAAIARGVDMAGVERREGIPDYREDLWNRDLDLPVLMYHRVGGPASRYQIPLWRFEQHLTWLKTNGYQTVTMREVYDYLYAFGSLPEKPVMLTFDDGTAGHVAAASALDRLGMTGVFFITSGATEMSDQEIRSLADRGHEIGSHTVSHPDLTTVSDGRVRYELDRSRSDLERITGREIDFFAYPFGAYNSRVIGLVQGSGYEGAVAAWGGKRWNPEKRWVQPRIEIGGTLGVGQVVAYVE